MKLWRKILHRLFALFRKQKLDAEMDEEMRSHIEMRTQENIEAGMNSEEARFTALRQFGWVESIKETCRDQRGVSWVEDLVQDVRYGARILRKSLGFTAPAVLTLAIGIGANTAIFSVINGVLLKPLPYHHSEELVNLWETGEDRQQMPVSGGAFLDWKEQSRSFEALSLYSGLDKNLAGDGSADRISGWQVSPTFLRILRVQPLAGRDFLPEEDHRSSKVVVLSHRLWRTRYAGSTNLLDRTIRLDGVSFTVIGILPPKALLSDKIDFLVPFAIRPGDAESTRHIQDFNVVGRLRDGVRLEQAQAELNAIKQRLQPDYPKGREKWGFGVVSMHEQVTGKAKPTLLVLFGAVGFVLLIACGNFANLLLAKAVAREKEIAVRAALGARRWRIIRQLLTESVLLSMLGGGLGLGLAFWIGTVLSNLSPAALPRAAEIALDVRVLMFSIVLSLGTGLVFGLLPALRVSGFDLDKGLKKGGRSSRSGGTKNHLQATLIISEVAFTLVLLAGAGLLLNSFLRLLSIPPGFDSTNALTMDLRISEQKYPSGEHRSRFLKQIIERLENLPGVEAVGWATTLPMGWSSWSPVTTADGNSPLMNSTSACDWVAGSYFRAMGVPLLKGRYFTELDNSANAPRRSILNEALANRLFFKENPVGKQILFRGEPYEIIGIAGSIRQTGLHAEPEPRVYLPQIFSPLPGSLIVRSKVPPNTLLETVRKEVVSIDSDQPLSNIRTMEQVIANSISQRRFILNLIGAFAIAALLLAAIGLYGVMAYAVTQRTHEIGMRMALGAQRGDILALIVRQGLGLTFVGLIIGLGGAFATTRVLKSFLYGVTTTDTVTFVSVAGLLVSIALVACYLPARRASKVDPMVALRYE